MVLIRGPNWLRTYGRVYLMGQTVRGGVESLSAAMIRLRIGLLWTLLIALWFLNTSRFAFLGGVAAHAYETRVRTTFELGIHAWLMEWRD